MSASALAPARDPLGPGPDAAAEAAHLRRLIETQPCCLMRVDLDGQLLAANAAALGLLGAGDLGAVLGRNLKDLVAPEHRERWTDFAGRIAAGTPASLECDLSDFSGTDRAVLLQSVPLLDHEDGVRSMIVAARDISASRRLEQVLEEREVEIEIDAALDEQRRLEDVQREAEAARADRQRLEALLAERETERRRLAEQHAAEQARLKQTLAEEHQLALLVTERSARQRLEAAQKELEQARADQHRLAAQIETAESARARLEADLAQREADLARREAEWRRLSDDHQAARSRLEERLAAETEQAAAVAGQAAAAELARLQSDLEAARARQADVDRLQHELDEVRAERRELEGRLDARERELGALAAEHDAERTRLERALAERQASIGGAERALAGKVAHLQEQADTLQLECTRLQARIAEHEADVGRRAAEHDAALADLQASLEEQRQLALLVKEREARQRIDEAEAALAAALEERQRLRTLLKDGEAERQRLAAEAAGVRANLEQALAAAALARDRATKALADQEVELQAVRRTGEALEALAGAGRVAREVGRELHALAEAIDLRTRALLEHCSLEAGERRQLETLRAEAVSAASLARQIAQPSAPSSGPDTRVGASGEPGDPSPGDPR